MRASLLTLIAAPLFTSVLVAQATYTSVAVQQPAWVGSPDWSTITVHVSQHPDGQIGPVTKMPFSGIEVRHSQQILADGAHIDHADTSHFYRDAQGRMRDEGTKYAVIYDPIVDATIQLHLNDKTYEQYSAGGGKQTATIAAYGNSYGSDSPAATGPVETVKWGHVPYGAEPVTHVDTVQLGIQTINGLLCKGTRVTLTIPAHAVGNDRDINVINERWYSDDLQVLVKSSNDDPRFGTSTYELKEVTRADPDPSLFKLPEGFTRNNRH